MPQAQIDALKQQHLPWLKPKVRQTGLAMFAHYRANDFPAYTALLNSLKDKDGIHAFAAIVDAAVAWYAGYCRAEGLDPDAHLAEMILAAKADAEGTVPHG